MSMSNTEAQGLRAKVIAAAERQSSASMDLAGLLYETYVGSAAVGDGEIPLWEAWGFKSWGDYVERELHVHVSTASSSRRAYELFEVSLGGTWRSWPKVSFTKLRSLCRVVNTRNAKSWLKKASEMSACELEEEIQHVIYGREKSGPVRTFVAHMPSALLKEAKQILDDARSEFPDADRRGEVLIQVLRQWDALRKKKADVKQKRATHASNRELLQ